MNQEHEYWLAISVDLLRGKLYIYLLKELVLTRCVNGVVLVPRYIVTLAIAGGNLAPSLDFAYPSSSHPQHPAISQLLTSSPFQMPP